MTENNRQIDGLAPSFAKKPAIRQEDDGKRLLFECRIKADPKPSVTWSHNTAIVKESKRHKVNRSVDYIHGLSQPRFVLFKIRFSLKIQFLLFFLFLSANGR